MDDVTMALAVGLALGLGSVSALFVFGMLVRGRFEARVDARRRENFGPLLEDLVRGAEASLARKAAAYGLERLDGETDHALHNRIEQKILDGEGAPPSPAASIIPSVLDDGATTEQGISHREHLRQVAEKQAGDKSLDGVESALSDLVKGPARIPGAPNDGRPFTFSRHETGGVVMPEGPPCVEVKLGGFTSLDRAFEKLRRRWVASGFWGTRARKGTPPGPIPPAPERPR